MEAALVALLASSAAIVHVLMPRWLLLLKAHLLRRACRKRRAIVITFDDGPGRQLTPLVVESLAAAGVPATFFLLGRNVRGNEDLVEQIQRAGHEIGSHGEEHVHHVWSLPWTGLVDARRGARRLRDLTGRDASQVPFRPAYGKLNLVSLLWVLWHRAPLALWTHDSCDTHLHTELGPYDLAQSLRATGGGVVLLHDFDRSLPNVDQLVLAKLAAVLRLRDEGFQFLRVGELLRPAPARR